MVSLRRERPGNCQFLASDFLFQILSSESVETDKLFALKVSEYGDRFSFKNELPNFPTKLRLPFRQIALNLRSQVEIIAPDELSDKGARESKSSTHRFAS